MLRGVREYLDEKADTLAERLRDAGYRTACFTNNDTLAPAFGLVQGFDTFAPHYEDERRPYPWAPATHRAALDWAKARHRERKPYFLFVNDMEPHYPYTPPASTQERFLPADTEPLAVELARTLPYFEMFAHNAGARPIPESRLAVMRDLYDAEIACLDAEVGRFVDGLRQAGLLDEALLVVTSDHGENFGEHGLVDHAFSLHRTIRHVPLVIRHPPRFAPGTVVEDLVRLEDLAPTVLEIAGLSADEEMDGRSLLGDLPGRRSFASLGPPTQLVERMKNQRMIEFDEARLLLRHRAVTDGRMHYLRRSDGREELFDLESDPEERTNLAPQGGPALELFRSMLPEEEGEAPK
jgi:arylsulfatase A-like enzyme